MKKYTDVFLSARDELKSAVVGFEFEFYTKDLGYYATLEHLSRLMHPIKTWGFRKYHSSFTPDQENFKIEPDLSLGANGIELITGPLPYDKAKYYLMKILAFIQRYGYTTERSAIHYNISFSDCDLRRLNVLRMILDFDEEKIYAAYPHRKGSVYAKSIKELLKGLKVDYFTGNISAAAGALVLPEDRYYGINFTHMTKGRDKQRLEFRYIGGADYEKNPSKLLYFMDMFILSAKQCVNAGFEERHEKILMAELKELIKRNSSFANLDSFIAKYPNISLQINQVSEWEHVKSYYGHIRERLMEIFSKTENLTECIINYVTETKRIEIIGANFSGGDKFTKVDFVNCEVSELWADTCAFVGCEVKKSKLDNCSLESSVANDCKIAKTAVFGGEIINCYFLDGYLNGNMEGGVIRGGKIGPMGAISQDTKELSSTDNFYSTEFDDDDTEGKKGTKKYDYMGIADDIG